MKFRMMMALLAMMLSAAVFAQERKVTGTLNDRDTKEGVMQATVQLLKQDSTYVKGTLTDENGNFTLVVPEDGKYIVKFTSVGYAPVTQNITIDEGKDVALGTVVLGSDAIMLKGATVVGQAAKMVLKEDTFVYNASAYRTPEGSVLEELVKKLPGAKIDDDGKITINGKEVKKILVDGKEFMNGDTETAMKNLPTNIIDKIKSYDEKSDLARITGIDDGEEQTVLDFGIKPGMNKGFMSNVDLGAGSKDRYALRAMVGQFNDNTKIMGFANANNNGDQGFPGGGGRGRFGGGGGGLRSPKMVAMNINHSYGDKLEINGNIRWNHMNSDTRTESASENFVNTSGAFSNSLSQSYSRTNSWNAGMRLEWKPDSMTNILFRPNVTISKNDGRSSNFSASYNYNPYLYTSRPLDIAEIEKMAEEDDVMVNTRNNGSLTYSDNTSANAMLQFNRKLDTKGRNITLRTDLKYSDKGSESFSTSDVHLYQIKNQLGNDSIYGTYRYSATPTKNYSYALQATYSEPIFRTVFLQLSYKFTYNYNKSDRSTYDFSKLGADVFGGVPMVYRGWNNYFSLLDNPLEDYLDNNLSRYSEYKNYIHDVQLTTRIIRPKYQLNFGVLLQPQQTKFVQDYQGVKVDTTRTVTNFSPTLDFRYRFSKVSNLRINYRATTSQPSMSNLLDITDDSDPLNISKGNPGLKPSFTNTFRLFYNNYIQSHQQSLATFMNFNTTRNSIDNMVTYDEKTGGRTTRPENINGNWSVGGDVFYNFSVDSIGRWNVKTATEFNHRNHVGYQSVGRGDSQKNITKETVYGEDLAGSYRNDWFEIGLNGSVEYSHTRNMLQSQNNMDTWNFSYGGSLNIFAPWGTSLSTDIRNNCRRGYSDSSMNTNELIWNAQISQSFLKGRPLTVSLQFYDILHRQSNFSRTISAMSRSDRSYNSINSYAMLHVAYRLNMFGSKDARKGMGNNRGGFDGPGGPGGRMGGGFGGGFGGGRPPRM